MKKVLSVILATLLAVCGSIPVLAAEPEDWRAHIARLEKTYGVEFVFEMGWDGPIPIEKVIGTHLEVLTKKNLPVIEQGLSIVGASFTKKISKEIAASFHPANALHINMFYNPEDPMLYTVAGTAGPNGISLMGQAGGTEANLVTDVVHELGHCVDYAFMRGNPRTEKNERAKAWWGLSDANSFSGRDYNFNPTEYVSSYATSKCDEDFAECFVEMVMNGGDNPTTLEKNTKLYKKYAFIQEQLVELFGPKCRAAVKASEFLGISL